MIQITKDYLHYFAPFCSTQETKDNFLEWLKKHTDQNGILTLSKKSLKMVFCSELHDNILLPEDCLAVVTDSAMSQSSTQFNMETYSRNLKSSHLGHVVLYADITTSTMDLLEG